MRSPRTRTTPFGTRRPDAGSSSWPALTATTRATGGSARAGTGARRRSAAAPAARRAHAARRRSIRARIVDDLLAKGLSVAHARFSADLPQALQHPGPRGLAGVLRPRVERELDKQAVEQVLAVQRGGEAPGIDGRGLPQLLAAGREPREPALEGGRLEIRAAGQGGGGAREALVLAVGE